jgi:hypothetical protein
MLLMSLHDCSQRASSSSKAAHGANRAERDFFSRVRVHACLGWRELFLVAFNAQGCVILAMQLEK